MKVSDVWRSLDWFNKIALLYFGLISVSVIFYLINLVFSVFGLSSIFGNLENIAGLKALALMLLIICGSLFALAAFVLRELEKDLNKKISRKKFKGEAG